MDQNRMLRYWAAQLALGRASADEARAWADELMADGVYRDEFIAILESNPPRLDEVREPFVKALAKLGFPLPDKDTALWRIIDHITEEIAEGGLDPRKGVQRLYWEISTDMPNGKRFVWDSHDANGFCALHWEIEDCREAAFNEETHRQADAEIRIMLERVRKEAIRWQAEHHARISGLAP